MHQNVVVDNRPGASGAVGVGMTAYAPPDGYSICIISASNTVNSATNAKLPYDLAQDLQGVSQVTSAFFILGRQPSFPAKSVKELIAYAEGEFWQVELRIVRNGGITHLAGAMFAHDANESGCTSPIAEKLQP